MKRTIASLVLAFATLAVYAQQRSEIPILAAEKWWGAYTTLGEWMPLEAPAAQRSFAKENLANQAAPVFVSNMGRYIYNDYPFTFEFDGSKFIIDAPQKVEAVRAGKTLRETFVLVKDKYFKSNGQMPPELFFSMPQYNTWIELQYNQNQADVEKYADDILSNGYPAGILMIDDNWQRYYGNYDFKAERFPDPKGMIDRLHAKGFKIMVWVCPFVSPDSPEYRDLAAKGYLIKEKGSNRPALIRWWNGTSACYDLTNPAAFDYVVNALKQVQQQYGVDGFKLDAGDTYFYDTQTQDFYNKEAIATDQLLKWTEIGLHFPYNEYRATWKMQEYPLVQRLNDKNNSWGALNTLIPQMLNAGLMGYPYTCPDMIGGGQVADFGADVDQTQLDQVLIVRSAQVHALMPMMQFSVAPWRVLDKEHQGYCLAAAKLHEKLSPYILELAREAAKTGEPIIRHMAYMYPTRGFADCKDQFMLGAKYIVAPILTPDGKRTVRLPNGTWIDDQGQRFRGPVVLQITAPTGRLPYYEKR